MFTIVRTILNTIAIPKLLTLNPGTILLARIIIIPFITKVKSPRVRMFIGSVRRMRIGFIRALRSPIAIAAKRADRKFIDTPGSKYAVIIIATDEMIQFKIIIKFLFFVN